MEDSNENNDKLGTDNLPKDGNSEDVTFCESDAENSDKPATTTITVNNRSESCVEDQDNASIDILGDKENLPPELQDKTFTKNEETTLNKENKMNRSSDIITSKEIAGDVTFCESDVENIEEFEHINEVNFNANLSEHRNNTSTPVPPDNADIVHDVLNNSQRQPNTLDTDTGNLTATSSKSGKSGSKSASRSGSTSGSSSSSSSSSDGEDSDDSARDPDYVNVDPDHVNHNATDSASTETMDSFREIPSPQPSTSNNPDGSVKKGRKRIAAPSKWMQNKRKRLRNTGQAYKSNKNKDVPAKCVKPPCGENCRFRCSSKIIEAERRQIFEEYWKLEIRIWRRVPNSPPALQPAYENGIQIGASKKADLINLLEHFHIPSFYAPFYNTLFNL
ncbi:hypothetical protein O0L34_g7445 [Tuta absoluta]|nr:hypothetical protein O0L34_g7445 [Tuta absoluta]